MIEWISGHGGGKIRLNEERAATILKKWDDEWPGGVDESLASVYSWRRRALQAEARLRELGQEVPEDHDRQVAYQERIDKE